METLSSLLDRPEYVHAAINHFPLIGLLVALLCLAVGLIARSRAVQLTGLALCAGTSSITEGSFLNSAGTTLFFVTDNGGGAYTVDAVVVSNCGPAATSGTLIVSEDVACCRSLSIFNSAARIGALMFLIFSAAARVTWAARV